MGPQVRILNVYEYETLVGFGIVRVTSRENQELLPLLDFFFFPFSLNFNSILRSGFRPAPSAEGTLQSPF
jgi:hypothetical protein